MMSLPLAVVLEPSPPFARGWPPALVRYSGSQVWGGGGGALALLAIGLAPAYCLNPPLARGATLCPLARSSPRFQQHPREVLSHGLLTPAQGAASQSPDTHARGCIRLLALVGVCVWLAPVLARGSRPSLSCKSLNLPLPPPPSTRGAALGPLLQALHSAPRARCCTRLPVPGAALRLLCKELALGPSGTRTPAPGAASPALTG